jgi:hypothetical protein
VFGPASRQGKRGARRLAGSCKESVHYPVNSADWMALVDALVMMGQVQWPEGLSPWE